MALNFPIGPEIGDTFNPPGSTKTYYWNGNAWLIAAALTTATSIRAEIGIITSTTNSLSTTTGALTVAGGVGIGGDVHVGGVIYSGGVPALTTASFNLTVGEGGVDIDISSVIDPLSGFETLTFNNISTLETVTGRGASTTNAIHITNITESTATGLGALIIDGGLSVAKRINSESIKIADTVLDSTRTAVNTTGTWVIDSYLLSQYRSAKYLIQVVENQNAFRVYSIEANVTAKNDGTPFKTVYGEVTTNGSLGTIDVSSTDSGGDILIQLTFTPIDAELKIVRVLRTAMTAT